MAFNEAVEDVGGHGATFAGWPSRAFRFSSNQGVMSIHFPKKSQAGESSGPAGVRVIVAARVGLVTGAVQLGGYDRLNQAP